MESVDVLLFSLAFWVCLHSAKILAQGVLAAAGMAMATAGMLMGILDSMLSGVSRLVRNAMIAGLVIAAVFPLWVWWWSWGGASGPWGVPSWLLLPDDPLLAIRTAVNQWSPRVGHWIETLVMQMKMLALKLELQEYQRRDHGLPPQHPPAAASEGSGRGWWRSFLD